MPKNTVATALRLLRGQVVTGIKCDVFAGPSNALVVNCAVSDESVDNSVRVHFEVPLVVAIGQRM